MISHCMPFALQSDHIFEASAFFCAVGCAWAQAHCARKQCARLWGFPAGKLVGGVCF